MSPETADALKATNGYNIESRGFMEIKVDLYLGLNRNNKILIYLEVFTSLERINIC